MIGAATGYAVLGGLFAAVYEAGFCWRPPSWPKTLVKTLAVVSLVSSAVALGAPAAITAGLALGAIGDFWLSRPGERAFLAGMAAFALGHLAYAAAFWTPGSLPPPGPAVALLLVALSTEIWLAPRTGRLRWPVRGYVAVITLMALAALTLDGASGTALAGAGLFVLSDLLLALELFVVAGAALKRGLSHALWAAYWSGQALILWGMSPGAAL